MKRVLVTGATGTIGRAVCSILAADGWDIVAVAQDEKRIYDLLLDLEDERHIGLSLDVADPADWEESREDLGPLHGVVAAAAVYGPIGPLDEIDGVDIDDAISINLTGTMLTLRYTLPYLKKTRGRAVTFSGGRTGSSPLARYDAYSASKAAVARVTETVAKEYQGLVGVNCVAPGFIASSIHDATIEAGPVRAGEEYESTRRHLDQGGQSLGRVTELVSFLLSDESRGISGKLISVQRDPWIDEDFLRRLRTDENLATLRRVDS